MTLLTPWLIQPASGDADQTYSGNTLRDNFAGLFVAEGVLGDSTVLKVSQRGAGANMSVDVAAGWCVVQGDDVSGQGMYLCRSTATVNVVVPAAPVSGSRTHRIVARIKDKNASGSWTTYEWTPDIIADTTGSLPSLDASCLEIARVAVAAAQTTVVDGNITDYRRWRGLEGGTMGIADASGRPSNPRNGQRFYRMDYDTFEFYSSAAADYLWECSPLRTSVVWTSSPTLSDATDTLVSWTSADYETGADYWASSPNPSRVTVPRSGLWSVSVSAQFDTNATGRRTFEVRKNSGGVIGGGSSVMLGRAAAVTGATTIVQRQRDVVLTAADYLETFAYQNSGGGLQAGLGSTNNYMQMRWLGPS